MKDNNVFGRDCEIVFFVDNDLIKRCEIVGKKKYVVLCKGDVWWILVEFFLF